MQPAGAVTVVNPPFQPVPVVTQPGSQVAIQPGSQVGIDPGLNTVQVVNSLQGPLSVQQRDEPARHAFQFPFNTQMNNGSGGVSVNFQVPAGKILVIEYSSVLLVVITGQALNYCEIQTTVGGQAQSSFLAPNVPTGADLGGGVTAIVAAQPMKVYSDPGSTVSLTCQRSATGNVGTLRGSLSGYMLDTP